MVHYCSNHTLCILRVVRALERLYKSNYCHIVSTEYKRGFYCSNHTLCILRVVKALERLYKSNYCHIVSTEYCTKEDFTAQITHYAFCGWLELLRDSINRITVTLFQQSTRGDFNEKWIYKCQCSHGTLLLKSHTVHFAHG